MEEAKTKKPSKGTWGDMKAYPQKIKFTQDVPVVVTFSDDFEGPKEMPGKDNKPDNNNTDVFYIFNCVVESKESAINTSSWTLLKSLKGHIPLAGKTLIITKKNVGGKNMFYVETPKENEERATATPTEEQIEGMSGSPEI